MERWSAERMRVTDELIQDMRQAELIRRHLVEAIERRVLNPLLDNLMVGAGYRRPSDPGCGARPTPRSTGPTSGNG